MKQAGFTLLELVAAMAIFALMSVMAYGGLNALIGSQRGLEGGYATLEAWQIAVNRLRQDLDQVRERPIRDDFGDTQAAFYQPESGRVEFTHGGRRNPLGQVRSSLERVAYFLDTDGSLVRQSWRHLDRVQGEQPVQVRLLEDIETLGWRFLDDQGEWQQDWPPPALSGEAPDLLPPPRAVELLLESRKLGEMRFVFVTSVQP